MIYDLITVSLATYFLSYMISSEDGPFDILKKFRFFLGVNIPIVDMDGVSLDEFVDNGSVVAKIVSCPICLSFYISTVLFVLVRGSDGSGVGEVVEFFTTILSCAGISVFLVNISVSEY